MSRSHHSPNTITFPTGPLPESYYTANRGYIITAVGICFLVIEISAFALRTIARRLKRVPFGWDDALSIPALLLNLGICICAIMSVPLAGAGRHTLPVLKDDFNKIVFMGKQALLIMPILYALAVGFSKGVILNLYLRIFPRGPARKIAYAIAAIIAVHTTVTIFVICFQCRPLHQLWSTIVRENCIDTKAFWEWTSLPNIITDLVMLILPLPEIHRLQTTTRMKVGLMITFLTASVGIIASILRTVGFFNSPVFQDPCWESVSLMCYTMAEPGTYFLAACLPTYRPLLGYIKSTTDSLTSKMLGSRKRLGSSSGYVEDDSIRLQNKSGDSREAVSAKHVRGFDSIMLSQVSMDSSAVHHRV